jgi:hypothetical protein
LPESIFAFLGVGEVWHYRRSQVQFYGLNPGEYVEIASSEGGTAATYRRDCYALPRGNESGCLALGGIDTSTTGLASNVDVRFSGRPRTVTLL